MRIIYMGTPDFAVPALDYLYKNGYEVVGVVSQPDTAKDRGKKVKPTPVKEKALELGLKVLQPEKVKGNVEFFNELKNLKPDIIVVAAYGRILTSEILNLPKFGCVNIHGSILPRWRGAAPIQWSIATGDKETGVTIMQMSEGLDTGDMLSIAKTPIDNKTGGQMHDELAILGAELLIDTLPKIIDNKIVKEVQDDKYSTYARMISKKDGEIDFSKSAKHIENTIRAFNPWPGTYTYLNEKIFKIWEAVVIDTESKEENGTIIKIDENGIDISTEEGILRATIVQAPGKKRMEVKDFIRGNKIDIGTILG